MWWLAIFAFVYAVAFGSARSGKYTVRITIVLFMILCVFFGTIKVNFGFGLISNISIVWYTAAVALQTLCAMRNGFSYSLQTTIIAVKAMLFVQFSILLLMNLPDISASPFESALSMMSRETVRTSVASYVGYLFASGTSSIIVASMKHRNNLKATLLVFVFATTVGQFLSSLAFYPLAFGVDPNMISLGITGLILKVSMSILYFPLFYFFRKPRVMQEVC